MFSHSIEANHFDVNIKNQSINKSKNFSLDIWLPWVLNTAYKIRQTPYLEA